MRQTSFFSATFFTAVLLASTLAWSAESVQKIRVGFPSLAFAYLPYYVAQEKGFLKKYNLEAEYIQMRTTIQPSAVINGNINFFPSVSTGISAAVSGIPVVVVLNFFDGAPWILVTNKEINKPQDLIGKTVAVSGLRTSPHLFLQAALKKWEIAEKDVAIVSTGGTSDSFMALVSKQVAGTVLTPPFDDKAVSLGVKAQGVDSSGAPPAATETLQVAQGGEQRVDRRLVALWSAVGVSLAAVVRFLTPSVFYEPPQNFKIGNPAGKRIVVTVVARFVGKTAADMIRDDATMVLAERLYQVAVIERPGRVAVDHDHRLAAPFIKIVVAQSVQVQVMAGEGVEFFEVDAYHSTPSMRQLSPLPIPRNATRSPAERISRSSATAAVRGSETVPMLPRNS